MTLVCLLVCMPPLNCLLLVALPIICIYLLVVVSCLMHVVCRLLYAPNCVMFLVWGLAVVAVLVVVVLVVWGQPCVLRSRKVEGMDQKETVRGPKRECKG